MLKSLQDKHAGQAVRFLLFPSDQFGHQEPGTNADIKAFAEKYVKLGPDSNVILFAKSNLNHLRCDGSGPSVCAAPSASCCPANDAVYEYLQSVKPQKIGWNFQKIVVDGAGIPLSGEKILAGNDLEDAMTALIGRAAKVPAETGMFTSNRERKEGRNKLRQGLHQ